MRPLIYSRAHVRLKSFLKRNLVLIRLTVVTEGVDDSSYEKEGRHDRTNYGTRCGSRLTDGSILTHSKVRRERE